jgi:phosphatidylinositol alpha 1,6-mannosyltransferase
MDLVRHGDNGWLFPDDDPEMMRGAVTELLSDEATRQLMGQRARASVERRSWDELGDELVAHYRTLSGASDPSRRVA